MPDAACDPAPQTAPRSAPQNAPQSAPHTSGAAPSSQAFNAPVHAFRGFAILNILAIHCTALAVLFQQTTPGLNQPPQPPQHLAEAIYPVSQALFHGSTIYFALISGLLYAMVLSRKSWSEFFRGKLTNVVAPYVLVSFILTLFVLPAPGEGAGLAAGSGPVWGTLFDGGAAAFARTFAGNLVFGRAVFPLWYIPVLLVLFALTPLLAGCLRMRRGYWVLVALAILPLVVSRTGAVLSWQNCIYFLGPYALGVLLGAHYPALSAWLARHWAGLAMVCLVGTLAAYALFKAGAGIDGGTYTIGAFVPVEAVVYVQKLALAGCALVALTRMGGRSWRWLDRCADDAFALYFLHAPVAIVMLALAVPVVGAAQSVAGALVWVAVTCMATWAVCSAITAMIRRLFGKKSRMIIGA
ncbi:MAG: acyltransferase [Pseudomonadota bacterium]